MNKLVIIEDDKRLSQLIGDFFKRSGFDVDLFEYGYTALAFCKNHPPDIVIIDLNLPDINGITVCSKLREFYHGKILILTASGNDLDQIDGFETGADDYVNKPVEPRVLLARIKSLLKRNNSIAPKKIKQKLKFNSLEIDKSARISTLNNSSISLTSNEFDLLVLLAENAGEILSRDFLYHKLRGFAYDGIDRTMDIKISRLRKKLSDDAQNPQKIKTIWAKGYLFVPSAW